MFVNKYLKSVPTAACCAAQDAILCARMEENAAIHTDRPGTGGSDAVYGDRIAALATPYAESALAVVRVSGAGSIAAIASVFSRPEALTTAPGNTIHHGYLSEGGSSVDEVMVAVYRAPRSYTGEESAEIFCHGSPQGIQAILDLLFRNGFRQADPGEFTLRAFLNGKVDLTQAEAVKELVSARSRTAHGLALDRLGGSVFKWIDRVKGRLLHIMAAVDIQLDYPDDELESAGAASEVIPPGIILECEAQLHSLVATYRTGRLYQEGVKVAIAGRTNAGKSSLFNLMLREERSIVSEVHGTTRDYIEGTVVIEGIPVRLFDTAGLRATSESVESEGIRRSGLLIESAACVLYVVDGIEGLTRADEETLAALSERSGVIPVWNKVDSPSAKEAPSGFVSLSAASGEGLPLLHARMLREIAGEIRLGEGEPVIDSLRQKQLIDRSLGALERVKEGLSAGMPLDVVALDMQESLNALGEITGEVTTDDILGEMFSGFCVGK